MVDEVLDIELQYLPFCDQIPHGTYSNFIYLLVNP